jgi:hypothetical protein
VSLGLSLSLRGRIRKRALGAIRRGRFSRKTSSPTLTRTFESSSTRRRTAMHTAPSAAPEPPPRRTSGAHSGALLTPRLRRPHHEGFLKAPQITAQGVTVSSVGLRAPALARPAHKFTRLNHSSGLSALLRNFSLPMAANPAGAISESGLSNFKVLRRHLRVVPLFSPWPPRFCLCGFSG